MDSKMFLELCGLRPGYMNKEYMELSNKYLSNKYFLNNEHFLKKFKLNTDTEIKTIKKENIKNKKLRDIEDFVNSYINVKIMDDNIDDYTTEYSSSDDNDTIYEYISD